MNDFEKSWNEFRAKTQPLADRIIEHQRQNKQEGNAEMLTDPLKNVSRKSMLSFDGATCITLDEFREMVKEAGFPECSFAYGPHTDAAQEFLHCFEEVDYGL